MMEKIPGQQRVTVAGDEGYDTRDFVAECRNLQVTPHVPQNEGRRGGSAIDRRAARHAGYAVSQRKRIEECFGRMKTIGVLLRKLRHLSEALQFEHNRNVAVFIFLPAR